MDRVEHAVESGVGVFFIQKLKIWSYSKINSIPVPSGIFFRSIKPKFRSSGFTASSAFTLIVLPSDF